jgi:diguanylate cyclase (GGDEF)-like protein
MALNSTTVAEGRSMTRRLGRRIGVSARVLALSAFLAGSAAVLYVGFIRHFDSLQTSISLPWLVLAVAYAVSELTVVHVEFRRDAHSLSLNEIPLVLALVFASPGHLLLANLVGASAVLVLHRRQALLKLAFNLAHFALEDCVAVLVFHGLVAGHVVSLGPTLWTAAIAASVAAASVSVASVTVVIWVHQNRVDVSQLSAVLGLALVGAVFNACVGLDAVTVLWVDLRGAALLGVIGVILGVAYREYAGLRQRHAGLELLYEFTEAVQGSGEAENIVADVLTQAREMLRAEIAELALVSPAGAHHVDWLTLTDKSDVPVRSREPTLHPSLAVLLEPGRPVVGPKTGRDLDIRAHLAQRGQRDCIVAPLLADGALIGVLSVANRLGDVSTFDAQDGRLFETIAAHTSVTLQNATLVDRLRHDALHDNLTGLPNRVFFQQRLTGLLDRQRPTDPPVAVMLIDLDRFKEINDTLGHATGDLLLQEVAERLRSGVAAGVTVARLGGDEFALLDPTLRTPEDAVAMAARLRDELHRPFAYQDLRLEVSATIGISVAPRDGRDPSTLLRRADVAMYAAKNTAVGVAAYSEQLDDHSPRKLALVSDLRSAIETGALEVHYQPKVEITTGRVVGVEALVRWSHPAAGLVPPDEFVPMAEHTGLIGPMTHFVLRSALAQCRHWTRAGYHLPVAVNLSARSLLDPHLVDDISRALAEADVKASNLVLEITETSVMSDAEYALGVLNRLADMGLTLAIDDFGTGYSSLSYLKRLPVAAVKIDKSFVLNMEHDDNDAVIVRSIIDLARNLRLEVIAEGVETAETWNALRAMGCDTAQGYFTSRPLSAGALAAWLETVSPRLAVVPA